MGNATATQTTALPRNSVIRRVFRETSALLLPKSTVPCVSAGLAYVVGELIDGAVAVAEGAGKSKLHPRHIDAAMRKNAALARAFKTVARPSSSAAVSGGAGLKAVAEAPPSAGVQTVSGAHRFEPFVKQVFRSRGTKVQLSRASLAVLSSLTADITGRVAATADGTAVSANKKAISPEDILIAFKVEIPGDLADLAWLEARNAVEQPDGAAGR